MARCYFPLGALVKGRAVFVSDAPKNPDGSGYQFARRDGARLEGQSQGNTAAVLPPRAAEDPSYLIYGHLLMMQCRW